MPNIFAIRLNRLPSRKVILIGLTISLFNSDCSYSQNQSPCSSPKVHEFDFWIGGWTVYKFKTDTIVGYSEVTPVSGGCGIQENWRSTRDGSIGTSLNKFDFSKNKWHQMWIDNSGSTLHLEGEFSGNKMVLTNVQQTRDGKSIYHRITWFNNANGTVRQLWEQSRDEGNTWVAVFHGLYKKT